MAKKIFLTSLILAIVIIPLSLSYAYQAIVLSDKELDNVYAAGFDFDITAAYAFRAAVINQVVSQTNIAAVSSLNGNINNTNINNLNLASLNNQLNSTLTSQNNFAAIVAKGGDILNALINNINTADVQNNLGCGNGPQGVGPGGNGPQGVGPGGNGPQGVGPGGNASAIVTQTNVAAVIALNGNVGGTEINNSNYAGITNQGHSGAASQLNVAVVMAAGNILNTAINNAANVNGLTSSGGIDIDSVTLPGGIFVEFNHRGGMVDHTHVSQWNITFVKEGFNHHSGGHAGISNLINNIVGSHH